MLELQKDSTDKGKVEELIWSVGAVWAKVIGWFAVVDETCKQMMELLTLVMSEQMALYTKFQTLQQEGTVNAE